MIELPTEIINTIDLWVFHFRVREAVERCNIFRSNYSTIWTEICSDIRANTPSYKLAVTNYLGAHIMIYLRLPDCDIYSFDARAFFNSWQYTIHRKALPFY